MSPGAGSRRPASPGTRMPLVPPTSPNSKVDRVVLSDPQVEMYDFSGLRPLRGRVVFGARPSNLGSRRACRGTAPLAAPYRRHQRRVRDGAGNYRPSGGWQARSSKARPHPPRIAGVAGAPGSPHAEGALSSGAACPVAREFGGRRRCCTDPRDRMPFSAACEIAGRIRVGV